MEVNNLPKLSSFEISELKPNFPHKGVRLSFPNQTRQHFNKYRWSFEDGTQALQTIFDTYKFKFLQLPESVRTAANERVFGNCSNYASQKELLVLALCFFKPYAPQLLNLFREGERAYLAKAAKQSQEKELLRLVAEG